MNKIKWRGISISKKLLKNRTRNVWCRSATIPFSMINKTVFVHNGKEFRRVLITREKIGFKFGDFSFTRKLAPKFQAKVKPLKKK